MRVFQLNIVCGKASTGRIATDILSHLKKLGHEGKIAYGFPPAMNIEDDEGIYAGSKLDYYTHNVMSRATDSEGLHSRIATQRLVKQIESYAPDIVHLHNIHGHWVNYEILFDYLAKAGIPVVWTLHDCWSFTGHCAHFSIAKCEQWKTHCRRCPQKHTYPQSWFMDNSRRNFDRKRRAFTGVSRMNIVTPSEWLAGLAKEGFLGKYPVNVINNGIDTEAFQYTPSKFADKHGLSQKKIVLGVASEWGKRKGLQDFCSLAERLGDDYAVVLVGLREVQKDISEKIIGIQKTNSRKELAEIYSAATVFVNPTYEDTYPTVNLEALACGLPVITYRTGGSVEPINGSNGVIVEQGDVDGIINAIGQAEKLDRAAIAGHREQYSADNCFRKYVDLYYQILSR